MTITNWEQVPEFTGEMEEVAFWQDAKLDIRLMEASVMAGSAGKESVTITLRMDPRMLSRIKWIARSRYLNYQSMIKQWLSERIEEENNKLNQ
jgi:predicted DNA binding CopG/RHH family protein